jgi:hypothetical protein
VKKAWLVIASFGVLAGEPRKASPIRCGWTHGEADPVRHRRAAQDRRAADQDVRSLASRSRLIGKPMLKKTLVVAGGRDGVASGVPLAAADLGRSLGNATGLADTQSSDAHTEPSFTGGGSNGHNGRYTRS